LVNVLCSAGVAVVLNAVSSTSSCDSALVRACCSKSAKIFCLRGLVLGQGQRVERLDVADQAGVGGTLRDQVVQGDHVVDRGPVVGDHRQRGLAGLGRVLQLGVVVDHGEHGGHLGLDVRRVGPADPGGQRPDPGRRGVGGGVPVLESPGIGDGQQPGRFVALVLQGLHEAGDLLPEGGELRHMAEFVGAVGGRHHPQAPEDQAHEQGQHDHRDQAGGHRPVPQGQRPRAGEMGGRRFDSVLAGVTGARCGARHPVVSHR
jgi:hypothetical protein